MEEVDYAQDVALCPGEEEEQTRKRQLDNQQNGRGEKRTKQRGRGKPTLKILVPNFAVGKLIGKKGANINELESKHDASIDVSPAKDFFPGTLSRSVAISADIEQIIEFVSYVIQEVIVDDPERGPPREQDFSFVITNPAVGYVIGKGGSVIKGIQEESCAGIDVHKSSKDSPNPVDRLVTITGSTEQKIKAIQLIIGKLSMMEPIQMSNPISKYGSGDFNPQSHSNGDYTPRYGGGGIDYKGGFNLTRSVGQLVADPYASIQSDTQRYGAATQNDAFSKYYGGNAAVGSYDTSSYYEPKSKLKVSRIIELEVPNVMVGSIVGKQGLTIREFTNSSGAEINFSGKDEFVPGTENRILRIKGTQSQIEHAYKMIDKKVAEIEVAFSRPSYQ